VALRAWGGAAWGNSADLAGELGWGVAREKLGVEWARSGCSLAAGTGPTAERGGDRRRLPLEAVVPASGGSA
jgi:hypothetical protein